VDAKRTAGPRSARHAENAVLHSCGPMPAPLPLSRLRALFGEGAIVVEAPVQSADEHLLLPEEQEHIRAAAAVRRAEFGTARVCARRALSELGVAPAPLVPRADRSPSWPAGIAGSISHTRDRCAVVVARQSYARSLGLDIEAIRTLDEGIDETILTSRELRVLRARPPSRRDGLLMLFFSAKEAFYKCQYPVTGAFLDFRDVELDIEEDAGRFDAHALKPGLPDCVRHLGGRFAYEGGVVLCGIELLA
jgi:4'-phosphopantetheinyl transferase EntD